MSDSGNIKVSQVTGNFHRIARDLDRALRAARFTTNERFFIDEARELSWGSVPPDADPLPFKFNLHAVERLHGIQRTKAKAAVRSLVAARVFIATEGEMYLINKDYREWLAEDGSARLSVDQIEWCYEARRRASKPGRGGVQTDSPGGSPDRLPQGESKQTQCTDAPGVQIDSGGESKQTPGGESKQTPFCDPPLTSPPEIQREERERESRAAAPAHADTHADTPGGARTRDDASKPPADPSMPAYPSDPELAPVMIGVGAHPEEPEWAAGFWAKLWNVTGSTRVLWGFYQHQRWYSRECWESGLATAVRRGVRFNSIGYLESIVADHDAHGAPAESPAKPAPRMTTRQQKMATIAAFLTPEPKGGA